MYKKLFLITFVTLFLGGCGHYSRMEIVTPVGEKPVPICPGLGEVKSPMDPDVATFTSVGPRKRSVKRIIYLVRGRYSERQLFIPRDGRWYRQVRPDCQFTINHGLGALSRRVARHVSELTPNQGYTVWVVDIKNRGIVHQSYRTFRVHDRIRGDRIRFSYGEQLVHQEVRLPRARVPDLVSPTIGGTLCFGSGCE